MKCFFSFKNITQESVAGIKIMAGQTTEIIPSRLAHLYIPFVVYF